MLIFQSQIERNKELLNIIPVDLILNTDAMKNLYLEGSLHKTLK